jgi:hypothetical protein
MPKLVLVSTAHRENGLCNVDALLRILREIQPEVIFEEVRPSDFDPHRTDGVNGRLEAQAIARYIQSNRAARVPVDRYEMSTDSAKSFSRELFAALDHIEDRSPEYGRLRDAELRRTYEEGFCFLNSPDYTSLCARLNSIEDEIILDSGQPVWIHALNLWRSLNSRREQEMVGVIYDFCKAHAFEVGVFLAGAAHQNGVLRQVDSFALTHPGVIAWSLYGQP